MQYKHFLITLFNVPLYSKDKNNNESLTPLWLEHRFYLFETYCLPSIKQQSCQDFRWMVFFDKETPQIYKDKICRYAQTLKTFIPYYIGKDDADILSHVQGTTSMEPVFKRLILEYIQMEESSFSGAILTTNIDNDDSFHKDTIQRLQQAFKQHNTLGLYNFRDGYQYICRYRLLLKMHYPHNHFLTLASPFDTNFCTVKAYKHAKIRSLFKVENLPAHPRAWIELIHEDNVSNDLRISSRISNSPILKPIALTNYGLDLHFSLASNLYKGLILFPLL